MFSSFNRSTLLAVRTISDGAEQSFNKINLDFMKKDLNSTVRQAGAESLSVSDLNRFEEAMSGIDSINFTGAEQRALLAVAKELVSDGVLDRNELNILINMINDFSQGGDQASDGSWPHRHLLQENLYGDPLKHELSDKLSSKYGHEASNHAFLTTANSLLNLVSSGGWEPLIRDAINNADLNNLSPAERIELIATLTEATKDGEINQAEGSTIQTLLAKALESGNQMPRPAPAPLPPNNSWGVAQHQDGKAAIDIGNYLLRVDENSGSMELINKHNGESSQIFGFSRFDTNGDGAANLNFRGPITLNLEDGTRVTVNTKPSELWSYHANTEVPHQLVITRGDQAMVVNGLDSQTRGDLTIAHGSGGQMVDFATPDGVNLFENPNGTGWLVMDGYFTRPVQSGDVNGSFYDDMTGWGNSAPSHGDVFTDLSNMRKKVASMDLAASIRSTFSN